MNKKVLMMMLCLITSLTLGYMYGKEYMLSFLNAQSAPAFTLPKGSKVVLGSYNGKEIVWDIGNNDNNGSYVLMSSKPIEDEMNLFAANSGLPVITSPAALADRENAILKIRSDLHPYCPVTPIKNKINQISLNRNDAFILIRIPFLPSVYDVKNGGNLGLSLSDRAYSSSITYWIEGYLKGLYLGSAVYMSTYHNASQKPADFSFDDRDVRDFDTGEIIPRSENIMWSECQITVYQDTFAIRPFAMVDKTKIMFTANTSYTDGSWHNYKIDTVNLNKNNELNPNKLRIQSSLTASLQDIKRNSQSTSKVMKNSSVDLSVTANTGINAHISVIMYNETGTDIQYYKMLEATKNGTNDYTLDLTGIPVGKYQVAVINEEYDASSNLPVESSAISDLMPLEIVEPHKITYTQTPQSGASAGNDYEFSKNVNAGQAVGKVTANPLGVTPLVYDLIGDGDNSYQNFEIDGLDANNASSNTPLNVKIKSNAPDLVNGGLKAGNYKFCITAVDANGDPVDTSGNPTEKVCTSFDVKKTKSTISFDTDDQGTIYVSGSTTGTTNHGEHATHTNGDITDDDVNIEYSFVSGNSSIISSGLPFTSVNAGDNATIVFAANATGSIVIQAKVPETDNYEAAATTKTIILQLELYANYIEDKANITAGSSGAKPPASYTQSNRIGHIDASGGTAPFTYTLPSGQGNNGSFYIDSSGNVYVNTSVGANGLTPGSYTIVAEVKDNTSPTKQTTTVTKTITIGAASLSGAGWENPDSPGNALGSNTYTITYDPSGEPNNGGTFNTKLVETTTGALANTIITYTLDPNPNAVISISGTSTVNVTIKKASNTSEKNMVKIKAHITGGIYGSTGVDTELIVNVDKYPQTIAFPDTNVLKLPVGGACVSVPASITSTYSKSGETIQYTSSNTNSNAPFTINAQGQVCPTSNASDAGSATLTGTLNGDDNYEAATTPTGKVIQVYVPGNIEVTGSIESGGTTGVTYTPDTTLKKALHTSTNPNGGTAKRDVAVAQVSVSGSTFAKNTGNGTKNADANLFTVTPTGYITLNQDITASDLTNHGTGNRYYIQVDVTDSNHNTRTVDIIIVIENAQADFYFIDPITGAKLSLTDTYGTKNVPVYKKTYEPNGTIDVKTNIDSTYSEVTIAEASGIDVDEDVIDHNNLNHFNILNASDPNAEYGSGGHAYVKACMSAQNGYAAQCIYAKVIIEKAEQSDFAFVNTPKWTIGKTPATIQPTYNGKLSQGDVLLSSSDNTIAEALAPINGQDQSFETKNKVGTATLTAISPEDRNYKSKTATTILETTERPPTSLTLYVPGMTYGDTNIEARISGGYKNGIPAYFYVDDTSILEIDKNPVNVRTSPSIKAIGSGQVIVKVCQTNEPFDPAVDDCNAIGGDYGEQIIIVKRKAITFTYKDEEVYVGEAFPQFSFQQPSANAFAFNDSIADFPIPKNTSAKKNGTAINNTNTTGSYDISGSYGANELSGNTKHYEIKIESGTLTIKQDKAQGNWYHLEDPNGNSVSADDWHNYIVDVVIDVVNASADAGVYDQISNTNTFSNVDKQRFTVTKEDDNKTDIYFRIDPNGTSPHKGAISEKIEDHVKIDMTNPKVVSITGYPVNDDGLSNLLNEITLGHYFKPGVQVEIKTDDPQPQSGKTVKVSGIKEVSYRVYELDDQGIMTSTTPIQEDTAVPGTNKILSFKINNIGNYRVCATTVDNATNESTEKCSDLNIKKIDVDVDGDGKPDFNDPDGDGCPDLNIKWKDPNNPDKWIVINGDRDYDGIPDINIDSDGDGKSDLNIDTDYDGKPDLNLVILKKSDWKPNKCVKADIDNGILEEYCTGTSIKAAINIDTDDDGIPNINIDTDGDMKADFNISFDGENPFLNIGKVPEEWKPDKNYTYKKFSYDTMKDLEPLLNMGIIDDRYPSINVDTDGDGIPDLNIDTDGDGIPDVNIDGDGDGVPDINIDTDGDGIPDDKVMDITEWKPGIKVDGDVPYYTMDIKYKDPSDIDDETPTEPNKPKDDKSDTSVMGQYNPVTSMGGANTGDNTFTSLYFAITLCSLGNILFLLYRRKKEN